jgi:hypothetical protein
MPEDQDNNDERKHASREPAGQSDNNSVESDPARASEWASEP